MHLFKQVIALVALLCLAQGGLATHAVYTNEETGEIFQLQLDGYTGETGETEYYAMNTTSFVPTRQFKTPTELATLVERDICEYVADCFTTGAYNVVLFAQTVTWANTQGNCIALSNTISNYLTNNNYANTNSILQGLAVGIIVAIPTFYINIKLANTDVATTNDACGDSTAPTVAANAADGIYAYCIAIQANNQNNLPTRYGAIDVTSSTATQGDGLEALASYFMSSQEGVYAPICSAFGITWKRAVYRLGQVMRSVAMG